MKKPRGWAKIVSRAVSVAAIAMFALAGSALANPSVTVNAATTGSTGTGITISHSTPTQFIQANKTRRGWCAIIPISGAGAGTIAALCMPGDSSGTSAANMTGSAAPSQTVGFPIMANSYVCDTDFTIRMLDAVHVRWDCEVQGGSDLTGYTNEE